MNDPNEKYDSREDAKARSLDQDAISAIVVDCAYRVHGLTLAIQRLKKAVNALSTITKTSRLRAFA